MKLYEIAQEIENLIDEDTGEITNFELFEALNVAKTEKIHNIALYLKNSRAEEKAIKEEIGKLQKRAKQLELKNENLKNYLSFFTQGKKYTFPNVTLSTRNYEKIEVNDKYFINWALENAKDLLRFSDPQPNKIKIGEILKDKKIPFVEKIKTSSLIVR